MKKNSVRILALLLAALLALSACGGKDTTTQPGGDAPAGNEPAGEPSQPVQPDNGGEAITDFVDFQLQSSEIRTFCLLNSEDSVNSNVLCNAYSPLLELNNKGALGPAVAKEWGTEDGGLTWTFKLRDDVVWVDVDGNEKAKCTAQD